MAVPPSLAIPRLCISSTSGGGGKTLLSLGLAYAWHEAGLLVKPFKKGPDYIDAAWLAAASDCTCTSLDPFFLAPDALRQLFIANMLANPAAVALIEGNRGLYDGLNETGECSTAQVARILHCPIVLSLDCEKVTRTMAAIVKGLTSFEPGLLFAGLVLNRVGSVRHERSLRQILQAYVDLPVLGALPRQERNYLPERHMGLASCGANLQENLQETLAKLADLVRNNCDLAAMLAAARQVPPLAPAEPAQSEKPAVIAGKRPVIGYVRDKALWFYYPENLQALEDAGCELRQLSLLADAKKWQGIHGLYLGGGFPEDFARDISAAPQLPFLRAMAASQMPIYAECGGLLVLCRQLDLGPAQWPMAGIIPATARFHKRPRGLGYVDGVIVGKNGFFPVGEPIRGHEFHYCDCVFDNPPPPLALRLARGVGLWRGEANYDGFTRGNVWAAFTHIFAPALPRWATNFAILAQNYMKGHANGFGGHEALAKNALS